MNILWRLVLLLLLLRRWMLLAVWRAAVKACLGEDIAESQRSAARCAGVREQIEQPFREGDARSLREPERRKDVGVLCSAPAEKPGHGTRPGAAQKRTIPWAVLVARERPLVQSHPRPVGGIGLNTCCAVQIATWSDAANIGGPGAGREERWGGRSYERESGST
jgi:hypothetical protein